MPMLTVSDALQHVVSTVQPTSPRWMPLSDVHGLVLAQDVISTVDSPPFDKSLMDGYAVQAGDVANGSARLRVLETITAGQVPRQTVLAGTATQIMTGAPLPTGADAVVKIEDCRRDGEQVSIESAGVKPGLNLIRRAAVLSVGETVLRTGDRLHPARIAALAELGHPQVLVWPRPAVAVLATGDELVTVDQTPGPGQIRNSNEPMLVAQFARMGAVVQPLGIARDDRVDLASKIRRGLESDLLVLSGGVSAGQLDLVPSELAAAGVQTVFHKIDMKPGKPLWFGVRPATTDRPPCYVFGLPGNPVSSLVCAELFVQTALRKRMGLTPAIPQPLTGRFEGTAQFQSERPIYHPAVLTWTESGLTARLVRWQGSSDLRATVDANGMVAIPKGPVSWETGVSVTAYFWDTPGA
jgi:molybdopterin molybdotransferase